MPCPLQEEARAALDDGVAFAEAFLANPDMPVRIARQAPTTSRPNHVCKGDVS